MPMSYKGNQEKLTSRGIIVTCANGGKLVSIATYIIFNYQGIPSVAKECHKFPNHQLVDPLLSLGKLTEHGCNVNFKKDSVEVTNSDGITILVGQKPSTQYHSPWAKRRTFPDISVLSIQSKFQNSWGLSSKFSIKTLQDDESLEKVRQQGDNSNQNDK